MGVEIMFDFFARLAPGLALVAGLIAVVFVGAPGPGYKFDIIPLGTGFQLLRYGAYFGLAAGGLGAIGILARLISGHGALSLALIGLVLGLAAVGFVENFRRQAAAVPPIHDITTDTENPPQFVAAIPAREAFGAANPPEYVGDQPEPGETGRTIREAQLAHYTDLGSVFIDADPGVAFAAVLGTVEDMGWELLEANTGEGRVEAVDTTFWYGFKDDVVIRVEPLPDGSVRVDVRSKSRVGVSDLGTNAQRIRDFFAALQTRTGGSN